MTVHIDARLCNGCPDQEQGCCEEVCPGDLLYRESGRACLREPSDCWDCFACVKACPRAALFVELPFQISEARLRLSARQHDTHIDWTLRDYHNKLVTKYSITNKKK
jgi:adenylylsulfate reductase subunit B